ncbi:unnamed protein product [Closterium sp. NIES-65]|nr:unnamed protein product [Closterium sp. NIES-65]
MALLGWVMRNSFVEFDGRIYQQVRGTAMGTPVAVCFAILFMSRLDELLRERWTGVLPIYHIRYIDDGLIIWPRSQVELEEYVRTFNGLDPNIRITWNISEHSVDFLDVVLSKGPRFTERGILDFGTFQRPMNRYLYLPFSSFHPRHLLLFPYLHAFLIPQCSLAALQPPTVAGMGEVDDPLFLGFGGHRLVVSRKLACTPLDVGNGDAFDEPLPCVLSVVNATDSSTLSSTAHLTATNTIMPSSSSSASVAAATYECSPGCRLQRLANGVCDAACNTPACAFDGGDCACVDPLFVPGICACPPGHTRRDNGSCCLSTAVGANLNFPFSLQRYGPNYIESNFAFAAERGFAANRFVSHRNRAATFLFKSSLPTNSASSLPSTHAAAPGGVVHVHKAIWSETLTFVLTTVSCKVTTGGSMSVTIKSQPAAMAMYDASADNIARLVLEMVYLVGLLWNVCGELHEMADRAAIHGSVLSYFGLVWNRVDMLSLTLVVLWRHVAAFDMQPRYDIYYTLLEMPRYWAVMDFQPYLGVITRSLALATPSLMHFFLLSFTVFFCFSMYAYLVFRGALKMFTKFGKPARARVRACVRGWASVCVGVCGRVWACVGVCGRVWACVGVCGRVWACVGVCGRVWACVGVCGRVWACVGVCGRFSTVLESMFSCFLLLLNDNGSAYFFQRMESWDLIATMLFFFMFIVFMVFILLNFLIAIIVDAFMSVKDSKLVATSIAADLAHIFKYKWNYWRGRYLPYPLILDRLVELGAKDTRVDEQSLLQSDRRMRRVQSMKRQTRAIFSCSCGGGCKPSHLDCAENHPTFPSASKTGERLQHVLTVREKRIDVISLSMILQRRQDRERVGPYKAESPYKCFPRAAPRECADDEQLDQLSQAVVLQCGEVVKQAALPVKKSAKKLSLAHLKEDLARSEAKVKELSAMMTDMHALMLDLLARTPPLGNTAHSPGTPGGLPALSNMPRAYTEPPWCLMSLTDSPPPLEQAGNTREVPRRFSESGGGGGPDEGEKRAGATRDGWSPAGGSSSRTPVQVSRRLSESGTGGEAFRGEKRVGGARDSPSSAGGSSSRTPVQASRVLGRRVSWQDGRGAARGERTEGWQKQPSVRVKGCVYCTKLTLAWTCT